MHRRRWILSLLGTWPRCRCERRRRRTRRVPRRSPFRAISAPTPRPASSGGTRPVRCRRRRVATGSRSRSFAPRPALPNAIRAGSRRTSSCSRTPRSPISTQRRLRHDERIARSGFGIAEAARRRHRRRAARLALPARRHRRAQPLCRPHAGDRCRLRLRLALETTQPVLLQGDRRAVAQRAAPRAGEPLLQPAAARRRRHAERRRRGDAGHRPRLARPRMERRIPRTPTRSAGTGSA